MRRSTRCLQRNHRGVKIAILITCGPRKKAKKKNGEWRFCVDFRALNYISVKDAYPLPRKEETLQALHGNSFFTILDHLSGFWQIPLTPSDRHNRAFETRNGLYQFKVMSFGLTFELASHIPTAHGQCVEWTQF